ncbi:aminotransferase class I/II-fold pyridoxal phosphate-dependent enzyme [Candidatus Saccharibacteria bacterium]|nr:aminotransferase class I/II-fold pyridoxal phosphate-dependent enzyme [Candidatus Saccharibacteria bacterium]
MAGKRIYLASPQMLGKEREYVKEAFDSNWIAPLGPFVTKLEDEFKKYMPIGNAVALSAGTAALHLSIKLAGVKPGDVVFCSSLTFSASANPIIYEGGTPVFIDSEPDTYNMSPVALEKAFNEYPHPKAVIIVSLYGMPADFDKLLPICKKHKVTIIEDAAESLGATYHGKHVGTFGKYNIISFNGNKIITTSGGGMLLTDDAEAAEHALKWATQSREPARHYEHKEIGYNYRMSNVCAAIGCGQFENLEDKVRMKREIFYRYVEAFDDIDEIQMITEPDRMKSTHWLSVMELSNDSKVKPVDIMDALEAENIESRPIWKPMHMQPVFSECEFFAHDDERPVAEDIFANGVCLPSDTNMTEKEQERVIAIIKGLFA